MTLTLTHIYRHPVKGLSPESLDRVALTPGLGLPQDRRFAIGHGKSAFDPAAAAHVSKANFLMLARNEKLARLKTRFNDAANILTIEQDGRTALQARLDEPAGRASIEDFFAAFMGPEAQGRPRLFEAPGHMFSDTAPKVASIIGQESITALERRIGAPVDPRRFRANFYFSGGAAWDELEWTGRDITIGGVRLRVTKRIDRCTATNVNLDTAARDMDIPVTLKQSFGHIDMGVYAEVLTPGAVAVGDAIAPPPTPIREG